MVILLQIVQHLMIGGSDNNINRWATANQGPCPTGYHVPTNAEWDIADAAALGSGNGTNGTSTTGWDNATETFDSDLKLPTSGYRNRTNGLLSGQGTYGYYWSSTVSGTDARCLNFSSTAATTTDTSCTRLYCALPKRLVPIAIGIGFFTLALGARVLPRSGR